ncbi:MAG TPA: alpha/beta hydrolase [Stellaceae bacterium]|nr:alpha/beta hydrolase [Stellaceae bacterium]
MADEVGIEARYQIEIRDLEYQRCDGEPLLARLYRPIGANNSARGPFPALIEVHGGAWASGDRLNNAPLDEALAKSGIVVLAIDFRMPPQFRYPASIADVNLATRWLKANAGEFGSRRDLVGGLGTSSGAHQLLLSALRPADPRYAALPLAEAPAEDAGLPYLVLCWPISDPLARYQMVREKGNTRLVESHDAYWSSEEGMAEGNPQLILERGDAGALPPAILVQGLADDNVTPDMADRFTAAYRGRGGRIELHKFAGQPHTFIVRDPASDVSRRATELIRDFVLSRAAL